MVRTDPNRPDNPIVDANRAFERSTGYAASGVMGRNYRFFWRRRPRSARDRDVAPGRSRCARATTITLRNPRAGRTPFLDPLTIAAVHDDRGTAGRPPGRPDRGDRGGRRAAPRRAGRRGSTARDAASRKNHLQMVASMIRFQAASCSEPDQAFRSLPRRVESLAALHDEFQSAPRRVRGWAYDVVPAGADVSRVDPARGCARRSIGGDADGRVGCNPHAVDPRAGGGIGLGDSGWPETGGDRRAHRPRPRRPDERGPRRLQRARRDDRDARPRERRSSGARRQGDAPDPTRLTAAVPYGRRNLAADHGVHPGHVRLGEIACR